MRRLSLTAPVTPVTYLFLLAVALMGAGIMAEVRSLPSTDVVWHLHMAERILHGERLYVDLLEINPPLITGLKLPVVAVAKALNLSPLHLFRAVLFVVLLGSWAWTLRLRAKTAGLPPMETGITALALSVALFVLPFDAFARVEYVQAFGEREHLLVAGLLPWLAALALRLGGRPVRPRTAYTAGLVGGIALALKPQHGLIWAGVIAYALFYRPRPLKSLVTWPELFVPAALVPVYALGIAFFTPEYGAFLKTWGADYMAWHQVPVLQIARRPVVIVAGLAILLALVQGFRRGREPWRDLLTLALASAVAAYLVQKKDFPYHTYPIAAWGVLLLASIAAAEWGRRGDPPQKPIRLRYRPIAIGAAALLALIAGRPLAVTLRRAGGHDPIRRWMAETYKEVPDRVKNRSVMVLESQFGLGLLLIPYSNVRWDLGLPLLWPLGSAYDDEFPNERVPIPRPLSERTEVERRVTEVVIRDLKAKRPELVLILVPRGVNWSNFDLLEYLRADPRFGELLSGYEDEGVHGPYHVFRRRSGLFRDGFPMPQ